MVQYQHKDKEQWKRQPKINPHIHGQMISDKGLKTAEKDNLYNKWHWENWITTHRMMLDP